MREHLCKVHGFLEAINSWEFPGLSPAQPGSILDTLSSIAMFSVTEVFILKNYEPFKIPTKIANCEVMPKCSHFSYFKVSFFTAALFQFIAVIFPQKKVMKERTFSLKVSSFYSSSHKGRVFKELHDLWSQRGHQISMWSKRREIRINGRSYGFIDTLWLFLLKQSTERV